MLILFNAFKFLNLDERYISLLLSWDNIESFSFMLLYFYTIGIYLLFIYIDLLAAPTPT